MWNKRPIAEIADLAQSRPQGDELLCVDLEHVSPTTGQLIGGLAVTGEEVSKLHFSKEDVLFAKLRPYLRKAWLADRDGICSSEFWVFKARKGFGDPSFIRQFVLSEPFLKACAASSGSKMPRADWSYVETIKFPLPPLAEQRKIAEILRTWDEAIETAEAELKAKQERKRWQLHHALTQASKEIKHLNAVGHYFHPLSERNSEGLAPLSVTQDAGVVLRSDMTRRISFDEDTLGTYKVVRPNNFIISLRSFEGGIEMSDVTGCVSPAYQVFGPNPGVNFRYFRHYFKSQDFIRRLAVTVFGIRDGKQISYSHFSKVKIPVLTHDAQMQLADVADATEVDIKLSLKRLSKLREQKRGLMQKLLTGEVRVAV